MSSNIVNITEFLNEVQDNDELERNRELGWKTLATNIRGCVAVAETIKSTLGPSGMDKLLYVKSDSGYGDVFVSNDGASILSRLEVKNPSAMLLLQLAKAQDETVGDGTTSAVLLTAELLRNSKRLIQLGVHPSTITYGYRKASKFSLEIITDLLLSKNV